MIQDEANTTVRYLSNTNRRRRRRRRGKNSDYTIIGWRKAQSLGNRLKRRQKPNNPPRIHLRRKQTRGGGGGLEGARHCLSLSSQPPLLPSFPDFSLVKTYFCILMHTHPDSSPRILLSPESPRISKLRTRGE